MAAPVVRGAAQGPAPEEPEDEWFEREEPEDTADLPEAPDLKDPMFATTLCEYDFNGALPSTSANSRVR